MTQRQFERDVASVTGESVATIRRHGFSLVEPEDPEPLCCGLGRGGCTADRNVSSPVVVTKSRVSDRLLQVGHVLITARFAVGGTDAAFRPYDCSFQRRRWPLAPSDTVPIARAFLT
jgi:hypothetical protein